MVPGHRGVDKIAAGGPGHAIAVSRAERDRLRVVQVAWIAGPETPRAILLHGNDLIADQTHTQILVQIRSDLPYFSRRISNAPQLVWRCFACLRTNKKTAHVVLPHDLRN